MLPITYFNHCTTFGYISYIYINQWLSLLLFDFEIGRWFGILSQAYSWSRTRWGLIDHAWIQIVSHRFTALLSTTVCRELEAMFEIVWLCIIIRRQNPILSFREFRFYSVRCCGFICFNTRFHIDGISHKYYDILGFTSINRFVGWPSECSSHWFVRINSEHRSSIVPALAIIELIIVSNPSIIWDSCLWCRRPCLIKCLGFSIITKRALLVHMRK
jgi:hypothetical protein